MLWDRESRALRGGSFNKVIPARQVPRDGSNVFTSFRCLQFEWPGTD